jgi:hypothetical protein
MAGASQSARLSLKDWIAREATPFSIDSPRTFNAAVNKMIASLGDKVELLGFGEAHHGGEDILILALTPQSFTDFDWLAVLDSTAYNRQLELP